jgi:class 3 adenylate cyclase/putative methionine-R-sulfoxide reductase with GAF domain
LGGRTDLEQELAASRAREAALAEVLGVMRRAPGEGTTSLQAVLETVAVNAVRLCAADNGSIARLESDGWRLVANAGDIDRESLEKNWGNQPIEPNRRSLTGRVLLEKRTVTIVDAQADPEYDAGAGLFEVRSIIGVPLTRGDDIVGVLILRRGEPKPFTPEEVDLLETFADQASIAIENVRLFDETKESLDRQTAIGEVLRTISSSAFQLTPVLESVAKHAARLCDARDVIVWRTVGDAYVLAVGPRDKADPVARIIDNRPIPIGRDSIVGRAHLERQPIQVPDITEYYRGASGRAADLARLGGIKTLLAVPLIRDEKVLGVISLTRPELRPFSDEQIELVRTFADQAAIAIANVELFETVERQRQELSRFLSPQVAALVTSEQGAKMLEGHRRQITVVFCDLRGFTAFAESVEPEEVLGVLRDYHRLMGELIVQHQGTLEHFAGDGMMVFFNDPVLVERHELQAVRMAIAMRERFDEMARAWQKRGYELGFGVGIATGYATLGRIGFEGRYDYGAIGNVVILAQRLSAEAKAGQILLSQRVHAAVEGDAETTSVGDLALKGFTRPVPAFAADSIKMPTPAVP